jgi:hypothetical protein
MTDLPQWAMEKAEALAIQHDGNADEWDMEQIARALVEAEARGIERSAKVAEKYNGHPKSFRAEEPDKTVYGWGRARSGIAAAIRKLMEQDNEQ